MGPTGTPSEVGSSENVLLLGGGLGNAVLFSIAKEMREKGNRVIYFAGYKKGEDLFKREEIEEGTDQVIWSTDIGAEIEPHRPQDRHFRGNIVQSILAYGKGEMGTPLVPLSQIDRIIAIGSDRMMAAVKDARHGVLAAASAARSHRHCQHQLSDAVHDEGSLRAVPAEARRSRNRQRDDHLFLPESGSADGSCRLQESQHTTAAEHRSGKAQQPLAGLPPGGLRLLLNRQFLLARLRRAFLQDSPTPGGSLRFAHRGLISFTPPACKTAARKGCADISPGLSEAIPGVIATLYTDAR